MKHIRLCAAIAAALLAQEALAQATANSSSSSSANPTSNATSSGNNQSNTHSSTNNTSSTSNANQTATASSTNSQNNGSASSINANITVVAPSGSGGSTSDGRLSQSVESSSHTTGEHYQYIDYGGSYTIKNVPNVSAPPLISSNDTCMGSASGGVSVAGFGITGGSTYTDEHCKRIKMSRELWNKGMKAASLALDCMDRDAREALELTGFVCPQTTRARATAEESLRHVSVPAVPVVTYPPGLPAEALAPRPALQAAVLPAAPTVSESLAAPAAAEPLPVSAAPVVPVASAAPAASPLAMQVSTRLAVPPQPVPEAPAPIAAAQPDDANVVIRRVDVGGELLPLTR